jgi:hypothetical protein
MSSSNLQFSPAANQTSQVEVAPAERTFYEFRRKVRASELLSAAVEKLLRSLQYTGKVSIVIQNGRVLKSSYQEGYFRRKDDLSF